jgi:hypothetical protein
MLKSSQRSYAAARNYYYLAEPVLNLTRKPVRFCEAINKWSEAYPLDVSGQDDPDSALSCG